MIYYSTYAGRMFVVRKDSYYMSKITASRVAKKLAFVMEFSPSQQSYCELILTDGLTDARMAAFTGAEVDVLYRLVCWYSYEYQGLNDVPVFLVCNLNAGRSLVISEKK